MYSQPLLVNVNLVYNFPATCKVWNWCQVCFRDDKFRVVCEISMNIDLTIRNVTSYGQLFSTTWELNQVTNTIYLKNISTLYVALRMT